MKAATWSVLLLAFSVGPVVAQHNPNGQIVVSTLADPYLVLIRDPVVHKELRLNDEQRKSLAALSDELDGPLWTLRNQTGDRAAQLFRKLNATAESRAEPILTAAQRKRLAQMRISVYGLKAFVRDDFADKVKLSDSQRADVRKIVDEASQETNGSSPKNGKPAPSKPPASTPQSRIAALLSREQLERARETLGPPLDVSKLGYVKFKAPELIGKGGWINSPPLTMSQLKGKVVALHFYTFG